VSPPSPFFGCSSLYSHGSVNLTSAGEAEGNRGRDSGCGHRVPHTESSSSKQSMMNRPQPLSPDSKQILHDSVNMQETLTWSGELKSRM
jgi:hypothetical protein